MRRQLLFEARIVTAAAAAHAEPEPERACHPEDRRAKTSQSQHQHHDASRDEKNRATIPIVRAHSSASLWSCFCPARVSR
jgi:hypothetical protein